MPWQHDQAPSWEPRTRRGNMRKTYRSWVVRHVGTQTDGGVFAAMEWEVFLQALTSGIDLQFPR
jgi:hypothetical protein